MTSSTPDWWSLSDDELLRQCATDRYRASGPGGQKRNKTSSAVRLRHLPTGLIVIAEESRSQHENRAKAVRRLRQALALELRRTVPDELPADWQQRHGLDERLQLSVRDPRFWRIAAELLDRFDQQQGQLSATATTVGVNTSRLVGFFKSDPQLWQTVQQLRRHHGHPPLM